MIVLRGSEIRSCAGYSRRVSGFATAAVVNPENADRAAARKSALITATVPKSVAHGA
jgi:hypothetical protein